MRYYLHMRARVIACILCLIAPIGATAYLGACSLISFLIVASFSLPGLVLALLTLLSSYAVWSVAKVFSEELLFIGSLFRIRCSLSKASAFVAIFLALSGVCYGMMMN